MPIEKHFVVDAVSPFRQRSATGDPVRRLNVTLLEIPLGGEIPGPGMGMPTQLVVDDFTDADEKTWDVGTRVTATYAVDAPKTS